MEVDRLLARSVAEPSAFEALVHVHSPALHAYLARRAGPDADDLLNEVWLAAFRTRASFDPSRGPARPWLFGVARHVLHAHIRRTTKPGPPDPITDATEDSWDRIYDRLAANAARSALREALGTIAPADREVLLLVAWEQLTPTEAAHVLNIPAGTARSRLHRARERLRTLLKDLDPTAPH